MSTQLGTHGQTQYHTHYENANVLPTKIKTSKIEKHILYPVSRAEDHFEVSLKVREFRNFCGTSVGHSYFTMLSADRATDEATPLSISQCFSGTFSVTKTILLKAQCFNF